MLYKKILFMDTIYCVYKLLVQNTLRHNTQLIKYLLDTHLFYQLCKTFPSDVFFFYFRQIIEYHKDRYNFKNFMVQAKSM